MKNITKLTLKDEAAREARQIEEEVLIKEELSSIKVTPEMDRRMEEKLREYERLKAERKGSDRGDRLETASGESYLSEEDKEALAIGRMILEKKHRYRIRMPTKRKVWIALVAIMVLMFAVGITTVGSKSYWKELWCRMLGEQKNTVINVEDAKIMKSEDGDIKDYYREIERVLEIRPIRLVVIPKGMIVDDVEIDKEQRVAKIFYEYQNKIILYAIYANDIDSSYTEKVADEHIDTFEVESDKQIIIVDEYFVEETEEYRYVTNFEYQGIQYRLKGVMNREEFVEILENLYYF